MIGLRFYTLQSLLRVNNIFRRFIEICVFVMCRSHCCLSESSSRGQSLVKSLVRDLGVTHPGCAIDLGRTAETSRVILMHDKCMWKGFPSRGLKTCWLHAMWRDLYPKVADIHSFGPRYHWTRRAERVKCWEQSLWQSVPAWCCVPQNPGSVTLSRPDLFTLWKSNYS